MASTFRDLLHGRTKILAPLVGGSDLTFRMLCRKYGAEVTYTEMVQAHYFNNVDLVKKGGSTLIEFDDADRPLILQVAATVDEADEVIRMVNHPMFAGRIDGVDLNCGCPQGFAQKRGIGAFLFRRPDALVELVRKVSKSIPYPLSVKCRLHEDGVDATVSLLQRLVEAGAQCVALHGRYWWQKGEKRGKTDWEAMRQVRERIPAEIPMIANGDIKCHDDFDGIMKATGMQAGMSGYGALLAPGRVFCRDQVPSLNDQLVDYIELARRYGNRLVDVQRHIAWMVKESDREAKAALFQQNTLEDTLQLLRDRLGLELADPLGGSGRIREPIKIEEIEDPKKKKLAQKKERQRQKKAETKKRAREEKAAAVAAAEEQSVKNAKNE